MRAEDRKKIMKYMEENRTENRKNEQERIDNLKSRVVVIRPEFGYSKANNRPTDSKMPVSYFTMRWVRSDELIRNAALNGRRMPIITSSGRTFVD